MEAGNTLISSVAAQPQPKPRVVNEDRQREGKSGVRKEAPLVIGTPARSLGPDLPCKLRFLDLDSETLNKQLNTGYVRTGDL